MQQQWVQLSIITGMSKSKKRSKQKTSSVQWQSRLCVKHWQPPPPKDAQEIYDLTVKEMEKGYSEGFHTAQQCDSKWGSGQWWPIYRFLHRQSDGRGRLVDDGSRGE